ncbi:MAG: hypothetical protein KGI71_06135 [Patescibacteria group bacterium]|nr:hypothetical protein [Patescibacteria group bacterium]
MPQGISRFFAGAGQAPYNIARGISQRFGGTTEADVAEQRKLDQPLLSTGAGMGGNVIGNIAAYTPMAALPGANTMIGAAGYGALTGLAQPTESTGELLKNVGLGAVVPTAISAGARAIPAATRAFRPSTNAMIEQTAENQAVRNAMEAGYAVTPTQAKPDSLLAQIVEGMSGSAKMEKLASIKNAPVTNSLIREDLGLAAGTKIKPEDLQALRSEAGKAYQAVKNVKEPIKLDADFVKQIRDLSSDWQHAARDFPTLAGNKSVDEVINAMLGGKNIAGLSEKWLAKNADKLPPKSAVGVVEMTRQLRADASKNIKNWMDPEKQALGFAQRKAADALESLVDRNLKSSGKEGLVKEWQNARRMFAKTYDVESALNETTGNVDALHLGRLLDKGKPLTGKMKDVAEFARSFSGSARNVDKMKDRAQFSAFDYAMGIGAPAISGHWPLVAAALARPALRSASISRPVQNMMLAPATVQNPAIANAINYATRGALPLSAAALPQFGGQ